ncbi:MAG: 5-formyltetrahydrofolate cyclo-ligase [Pseudomonadales bacterium]
MPTKQLPARGRPEPGTVERRELRRFFRSKRNALDAPMQAAHAEAVARHFCAAGLTCRGHTVGAYLANDGELDTQPLIQRLLDAGKRLALPVVRRGRIMEFYRYRANTALTPNRFGIPEPVPGSAYVNPLGIDLLLVPLVAFDAFGMRLGMGAGYYDRFLGRLAPRLRPRLIGLAHSLQYCSDPLPFDDWDVPLDGVVTEQGWQAFDRDH